MREILRLKRPRLRSDRQPVLDAPSPRRRVRVVRARSVNVVTPSDGEPVARRRSALAGGRTEENARRRLFPRRAGWTTAGRRSCLAGRSRSRTCARDLDLGAAGSSAAGFRSVVSVPLTREGSPIGAIAVGRPESRAGCSDGELALLQPFADQAVIAIERRSPSRGAGGARPRARRSAEAAAATSEILRHLCAIAHNVQPVFETIVGERGPAVRGESLVMLHDEARSSRWLRRTACTPEFADFLARGVRVSRETASGRAVLERKPVQVIDFMASRSIPPSPAHEIERVRTVMAVPMLRDDRLLGVIASGGARSSPSRKSRSRCCRPSRTRR